MTENDYLLIGNAVLSLLLLVALIILGIKIYKLDKIRKQFFASGHKLDLEQVLVSQNRSITKINKEILTLREDLADLSILNKNNIQKVGFVRYNPFEDAGGNISFAIALLNDHGNGVVISSLHGREGTRMYAKSIKAKKSESKLTNEEIKAIDSAK